MNNFNFLRKCSLPVNVIFTCARSYMVQDCFSPKWKRKQSDTKQNSILFPFCLLEPDIFFSHLVHC